MFDRLKKFRNVLISYLFSLELLCFKDKLVIINHQKCTAIKKLIFLFTKKINLRITFENKYILIKSLKITKLHFVIPKAYSENHSKNICLQKLFCTLNI